MSDIVEFLRYHIDEAKIIEVLEKPSPVWEGRCILDMVKEDRAKEVLEALAEAMDFSGGN